MKFRKALSILLTLCMLFSVSGVAVYAEDVRPITTETVTYIDENSETKTVEAGILEGGGRPYGAQGETNWYIFKGAYTVNDQFTFYDAQVNLILADDADLTVNGNFVCAYGSLNIYVQENGTGKLTLTGERRILAQNGGDTHIYGGEITAYAVHADADHNGTLSIHSGKVNSQMLFGYNVNICGGEATGVLMQVKGTFTMSDGKLTAIKGNNGSGLAMEAGSIEISGGTVFAKGIYGMYCQNGSVTITGGTVTADASNNGFDGISAKNVSITGGNVTAHKGYYYGVYATDTLTLGADVPDTSISVDSLNADRRLVIKEGQTLTDGENDYTGTLTAEQVEALAGKTLTCKHSYDEQSWTNADEGRHVRVCKTCGGAPEYEDHDVIVRGDGDATCTAEGYTGDEFCSVCGQRLSEGEIIPPKGHITEVVGAKEATVTEDGYTGDEVCTVCGQTVKQGEVIPATDDATPDEPDDSDACPYCGKHHAKKWVLIVHLVLWFLCNVYRIVRK